MDFSGKISMVLKTNKLQIVTREELSEYCGFNRDTIRKAIERGTELGDRYTRIFLDKLSINPEWWDTGNGNIYLENPTSMQKAGDNKEKSADEIYRDLVEGNTEYILIPRSVLQEKYRLVSVEKLEEDRENWKKDKAVIDRLLNMYQELAAEMKGQLKAQSPVIKEAQ